MKANPVAAIDVLGRGVLRTTAPARRAAHSPATEDNANTSVATNSATEVGVASDVAKQQAAHSEG